MDNYNLNIYLFEITAGKIADLINLKSPPSKSDFVNSKKRFIFWINPGFLLPDLVSYAVIWRVRDFLIQI